VGEYRISSNTRKDETLSTTSYFLLGGIDMVWNPRLRTTLRIGEEMRSFKSSGESATGTPTLEFTVFYLYGKGSTLSWSSRYGQDQSDSLTSKTTSMRTGISINHVFTARTTAFCSLNWNRVTTKYDDPAVDQLTDFNIQCSIGLQYLLTSNLSFDLSYSYTTVLSSNEYNTYYRNITSLGINYTF
jgi:opacity protein-like surface antigen